MPLASKDGKLYVKDGKLCTSCCNQGSAGACCFLNDLGEYECRSTSESRCNELGGNWYEDEECKSENNPDGIDCSDPSPSKLGCCYVDIGDGTLQSQGRTTKGDCQASQDEVDPSIDCVWIPDTEETKDQPCPDQPAYTGACCYFYSASSDEGLTQEWRCDDGITEQECLMRGLDQTFYPGQTCEEIKKLGKCPPVDPPTSGICLYREDGLGSCWGYTFTGDELPTSGFPTQEDAQAYIDAGGCFENDPDAPECAKCECYPEQIDGAPPESAWGIIQECVEYVEEYDEFGNTTGNYICEKDRYLIDCTEEECQAQAEANPLADIEWRNDKPADKCKIVSSESECTESTGVFCPNVTECPDDSSTGCPETPNRSNPLP